jgi:hypothetical protein
MRKGKTTKTPGAVTFQFLEKQIQEIFGRRTGGYEG